MPSRESRAAPPSGEKPPVGLSIKTKDAYIRRQPAPSPEPPQAIAQGQREFIQEKGRAVEMKRAEGRRAGNGARQIRGGEGASFSTHAQRGNTSHSYQSVHPRNSDARPVLDGGRSIIKTGRSVRGAPDRAVRHATKTAERSAGKSVKTTKGVVKATAPTTRTVAKTAQRTAQTTVRATRQTVQAVVAAARAAATTAKAVVKATVVAVKAAIAAVQALAAAIAAGGWVVIVIILVICLVGLLIASPFGIFFADDSSAEDAVSPSVAVAQINGELAERLAEIQEGGTYDRMEILGQPPGWPEVLAVFAAKTAAAENGVDVAVLDPQRVDLLRVVFWDMTKITTTTETVDIPASGDAPAATEEVLTITITPRTPDDMRVFYSFTSEQNKALDALLENTEMLTALAGDLTVTSQAARALLAGLPADLSPERRSVVETACQLVGKVNYFWGGKSLVMGWDARWGTLRQVTAAGSSTTGTYRPYGLDCSGMVDWVFYNVSGGEYIIGHGGGAHAQHTYCTVISWEKALPGDLVFYPDDEHVGIVGGRDENGDLLIIHCAYSANNVVITGPDGFASIARPVFYSE